MLALLPDPATSTPAPYPLLVCYGAAAAAVGGRHEVGLWDWLWG